MIDMYPRIMIGCDPEFFFETTEGQVAGSEKVLGTEGPIITNYGGNKVKDKRVVLDGVQGEFNPTANACRALLASSLKAGFLVVHDHLQRTKGGFKFSSKQVVEVPQEELASLSEASRILGCAPSLNVYDKAATITVDAEKYRTRSAGGHIHLGTKSCVDYSGAHYWKGDLNIPQLIEIMDIIVGNTCVLIDRDPGQVERRTVYGRAGEYREQPHGVEYRTLSNFWLRSYPVASFAWGLARQAAAVPWCEWAAKLRAKYGPSPMESQAFWIDRYPAAQYGEQPKGDLEATSKLLRRFDREKVTRAINSNDFQLAWENWKVLRRWIEDEVKIIDAGPLYTAMGSYANWTLDPPYLDDFEFFVQKGLNHWFPQDPLTWWTTQFAEGHGTGWEAFLHTTVRPQRQGGQR